MWVISCPVWEDSYVEVFLKATLPATLVALKEADVDATFLVFSDRKFDVSLFGKHKVEFFGVPPESRHHYSLREAHRKTLSYARVGDRVFLLNADIVASKNAVAFAELMFDSNYKAIISIGIRALWNGYAPVGEEPKKLLEWAWKNRHALIKDLIWKKGKSVHRTMIFFESEGNVTLHAFYPYPIMLVKDRDFEFRRTIDGDLALNFEEDELYFTFGRECAFAELSLESKWVRSTVLINEESMVEHILRQKYNRWHLRCFQKQFQIVGDKFDFDAYETVRKITNDTHGVL